MSAEVFYKAAGCCDCQSNHVVWQPNIGDKLIKGWVSYEFRESVLVEEGADCSIIISGRGFVSTGFAYSSMNSCSGQQATSKHLQHHGHSYGHRQCGG